MSQPVDDAFTFMMARLRMRPNADLFLSAEAVRILREFGDACYGYGLASAERIGTAVTMPPHKRRTEDK